MNSAGYLGPDGKRGVVNLKDATNKAAEIPGKSPLIVSVGDSYISGEAGRWAGNVMVQTDFWRTNAGTSSAYDDIGKDEAIRDCHRSFEAEVNIRASGTTSVNLACSGAETASYAAKNVWKPGVDFEPRVTPDGVTVYGQAQLLQNLAKANPGRISMVLLSIGGNDFHFGTIVGKCVQAFLSGDSHCSSDPSVTGLVQDTVPANQAKIAAAIGRVIDAVGDNAGEPWTLMVQDYPSPVADSKNIRYPKESYARWSGGGCPMYNADLDWANGTALRLIDGAVRGAVADARTAHPKAKIEMLELKDALNGHRLCEINTYPMDSQDSPVGSWDLTGAVNNAEWVQSIRALGQAINSELVIWPFRTQESLHPNYWGQRAYQSCILQAYGNGKSVRGGACLLAGPGLDAQKRPNMKLIAEASLAPAPGSGKPGKVRDLGLDKKTSNKAVIRWRQPKDAQSGTLYTYQLRRPKSTWSGWASIGRSRALHLATSRPGRYQVKVAAQVGDMRGDAKQVTFRVQ